MCIAFTPVLAALLEAFGAPSTYGPAMDAVWAHAQTAHAAVTGTGQAGDDEQWKRQAEALEARLVNEVCVHLVQK